MRALFFLNDVERRHDVGDCGLVVGTEHRSAVRDDKVVALIALDLRMLGNAQPEILFLIEADVAALIVANHLGMHFRREARIHRIEMSAPADPGRFAAGREVGRQMRRHDGIFRHGDVNQPEAFKLFREKFG